MRPAEFKAVREYLGLPWRWVAARFDVSERTVARWETGDVPVPGEVADNLTTIRLETARAVDLRVAAVQDQKLGTLYTYRTDADQPVGRDEMPASWHRAMCARVVDECPGLRLEYHRPGEHQSFPTPSATSH